MATKKVAKKVNKKDVNKFDFSDSIKAIKGTAKTVNNQVKDAAEEVMEDLRENGTQLREVAVARAKKTYNKAYKSVAEVAENVAETVNVENISKVTKDVNDYTLKTAEELVEGAITNGEKWQGVAQKAVKGGLKLAAKQQDIVFDTLESLKGQLTNTTKRFRKLVSNN